MAGLIDRVAALLVDGEARSVEDVAAALGEDPDGIRMALQAADSRGLVRSEVLFTNR